MNGPHLFIHLSVDGHLDYFQIQLLYTFAYRFFFPRGPVFISLGVGLLIHKVSVCLTSQEIA